jgi:hypothetical protein
MAIKKITEMDMCSLYFAPGIKSPFGTSLICGETYVPLKRGRRSVLTSPARSLYID